MPEERANYSYHISILFRHLGKDGPGGAGRVAVNLANGLVENGHSVDLLVCENDGVFSELVSENVNVLEMAGIDLPGYRMLGYVNFIRKYLNDESPDCLIGLMSEINFVGWLSALISESEPEIILSHHNDLRNTLKSLRTHKGAILRRLILTSYNKCDRVVAVSDGVKDSLVDIGVSANNIKTIHNPVMNTNDIDKSWDPPSHDWFSENRTVIISIGRLQKQKNHELLIKSFSRLNNRMDCKLLIIGDGPLKSDLVKLSNSLGIQDDVEILDYVDRVYPYMAHASAFVLSSNYEGFGNVLVEALACGCPVISTDCPHGPSEILCDGEFGELVPPRNEEALFEGLLATLRTGQNQSHLKYRAKNFTVSHVTSQYEHLLINLAKGPTQ